MIKQKRTYILAIAALTVVSLTWLSSQVKSLADSSRFSSQLEIAQRQQLLPSVKTQDGWKQVYQQLPFLPLENKYVSRETGKVDPDNTLANRLIRYHLYVKGRSPNNRLDWKLTLADYLRVNELIQEKTYPGNDTLRQNPLESDRAAINRLNYKQRNALVQSLINVFNPSSATAPKVESQTPPQPTAQPSPKASPSFIQPQPGDAQLLMP